MIGGGLFIAAVLIIAVWVLIEVKRLRHKIFAFFLIAVIILSYLSMAFVFKGQEVDLTTISGVLSAGQLYFSWMGSIFVNVKDITANAVNMDWKSNENIEQINLTNLNPLK